MEPETIEKFKKIYSERKDVLERMLKTGNAFEKTAASIIIEAAGGSKLGGVTPATENLATDSQEMGVLFSDNTRSELKNFSGYTESLEEGLK